MELHLQQKVAVITGGTEGIGFATAREFIHEGAYVAICGRRRNVLENAVVSLGNNTFGYQADMIDENQVNAFARAVYEHFGHIDIWVNNVGSSIPRQGQQFSSEEIDQTYALCFKSTVLGSQAASQYLKQKGGVIINISSLAARCATSGRATLYGPLKSAVCNYTNTFAGEMAAYGIRVICVMPGFTLTPLVEKTISHQDLENNTCHTLLHRAALPSEIAKPIVFLASDCASYMTSTTVEVSGGRNTILNPNYSYERCSQK